VSNTLLLLAVVVLVVTFQAVVVLVDTAPTHWVAFRWRLITPSQWARVAQVVQVQHLVRLDQIAFFQLLLQLAAVVVLISTL
jgi:hypothetical protein